MYVVDAAVAGLLLFLVVRESLRGWLCGRVEDGAVVVVVVVVVVAVVAAAVVVVVVGVCC